MDIYISALQVFLLPQVIAGFMGGLLGVSSLLKSTAAVYGWELTLIFAVVGVLFSGGTAEYVISDWEMTSVIAHAILGVFSGILGFSGIDAFRLAAPKLTKDLMDEASTGIIHKLLITLGLRK